MRVPYIPSSSQVGRQTITKHIQRGGELPGVQYGTGFFGSLWNGVKKLAVPVLKSVAKEAFPMPTQALSAGLGPKEGGLKAKLKAAALLFLPQTPSGKPASHPALLSNS